MIKSHRAVSLLIIVTAVLLHAAGAVVLGQKVIVGSTAQRWITVTEMAAGTDAAAKDEALAAAQRKAVEQACGVFINAQSQAENYKLVYEKIFANTLGFIREYKVLSTRVEDGITHIRIRALVSMQKFEQDWATIAHTVERENNPRVIIAIAEATHWTTTGPVYDVEEAGTLQSKLEDFFLSKGIVLMDRKVAKAVSKRDIMLANLRDDLKAIAAIGAQFKADVVITGKATAKYSKTVTVAETPIKQYLANLNVRAIQTDSARLLASKNYRAVSLSNESKALATLADDSAPKLLSAIVEAWRKRAHVSRTTQLNIAGMDFDTWKLFKQEVSKLRGIQGVRLREITEKVANIDVEYRYNNEILADRITELKAIKLKVREITANRIRLEVVSVRPSTMPAGE